MIVVSDYDFLMNDYEGEPINIGSIDFPTAEHAFQAEKTTSYDEKKYIATLSIKGAREFARTLPIDVWAWDTTKYFVMQNILRVKFSNKVLAKKLLKLDGPIQMHSSKDMFWGCDPSTAQGENNLGNILMSIRDSLQLNMSHLLDEPEEAEEAEEQSMFSDSVAAKVVSNSGLSDNFAAILEISDKIFKWYNDMPGALSIHPELERMIEKLGKKVVDVKKENEEENTSF